MSNMLFKTNRSLFVRNYNFNLPRKVDFIMKNLYRTSVDVEISHFLDFSKNGFLNILLMLLFFFLFQILLPPTAPRGIS